jgi:glutamate carboxypeptidase
MDESARELAAFLEAQKEQMADLLEELVLLETPSTDAASQQPIIRRLAALLEELGYRSLHLPGRNSGGQLYASPRGRSRGAPCQLLLGHCDTVWEIGTLATMPFGREGDIIRGPGVYDMKAGLVEIVFALRALREFGLSPAVVPLVFINSDEEIGSRESTRYVRALARLVDRAMVMEPSLGVEGRIKTARKGVGRFTVTIQGKAAHAGLDPTAGASAILELSHVVQKLFALNAPERGASVNVGLIDGGVRANVVAPQSSAIVDVRVETQEEAARIEEAIHGLTPETSGVTLAIEGRIGRPPMERTPANRQLWRVALDLAGTLGLALEEGLAGGGSDGNTTSEYTATLDGLGAVGDGAHAAHEQIDVSQLPARCALLAALLLAPPLGAVDKQVA